MGKALVPNATRSACRVGPFAVRSASRGPGPRDAEHRCVLEHPHAGRLGRRGQSPRQCGGVHERGALPVPHPRLVRRRAQLGADGVLVQELAAPGRGELAQPVDLVVLGRDVQAAGATEVARDAVPGHRRLDRVQVLQAHPLQRRVLVREALTAVGLAVGQARRAEASVAATGGPADAFALEQHHVAAGVALLRPQRGPQPGEPAPDDGQVGAGGRLQRRSRCRPVRGVQPVDARLGVRQRPHRVGPHAQLLAGSGVRGPAIRARATRPRASCHVGHAPGPLPRTCADRRSRSVTAKATR